MPAKEQSSLPLPIPNFLLDYRNQIGKKPSSPSVNRIKQATQLLLLIRSHETKIPRNKQYEELIKWLEKIKPDKHGCVIYYLHQAKIELGSDTPQGSSNELWLKSK